MSREQFAEFDPRAWQDDGLLTTLPPNAGWIATRRSELFGMVVFGAATLLALAMAPPAATVLVEGRGDAASPAVWLEPFEPATEVVRDSAATPPGYWQALGRRAGAWPTAVEAPTESEAEPLV